MEKNLEKEKLRKIQLSEFDLLKKIDALCKKNDIKYYIIGGTLLGAVRHKGFIPWDDDIDISIMRKDFDKFCELAEKDKTIKFKSFKTDQNYYHYVPIVYDDTIDIVNSSYVNKVISHPWVDIFPYDNVPNNAIRRKIYALRIMVLRALINLSAFDDVVKIHKKNRPLHEKIIIFFGKKINFSRLLNTRKLLYKLDKQLKKFNKKDYKYISCLMGENKTNETIPKSFFDNLALYEFEEELFPSLSDYDSYLKHFYGDYMKMPEEYERYGKHNVTEVQNGKN